MSAAAQKSNPKASKELHGEKTEKRLAGVNGFNKGPIVKNPSQESVNELLNLYNLGQFSEALELGQELTKQFPKSFIAWNLIGATNKALGNKELALEAFQKATQINTNYHIGFNNYGIMLQEQGSSDKASEAFKKAISLKPDYAEAHNNLGKVLMEQDKLQAAIAAFLKALEQKPDYAEAHLNCGNALRKNKNYEAAIFAFVKALKNKPEYAEAHNGISSTLMEMRKYEEAVAAARKALSIAPNYIDAHFNFGQALHSNGEMEKALEAFEKLLSLRPENARAYHLMAHVLTDLDRMEESRAATVKAISIRPNFGAAHRQLTNLTTYKTYDTHVKSVENLIKAPDTSDNEKCHLYYAYAKMNEDLGNLKTAFESYVKAGVMRRKELPYTLEEDENLFSKVKLTAVKLKEISLSEKIGTAKHTPIFILGMPRSGTTLTEQIISQHPKVQGAGELELLNRFGRPTMRGDAKIDPETLLGIRNSYLDVLAKHAKNKPFVTDKMPHNFLGIGLILSIFPETKIIHLKRDAAAVCWSNFKNFFGSKGLAYSYDLEDTVRYFKLYKDLMDFWSDLHGDKIYHLDYDRLTAEQETETRKLIEHLQLSWDDKCLTPHENKRSIKTASRAQVRKEVYKGSSQAWLKYEPYLNNAFDEILDR